jgi:NTE family protein
MNMHVSRARMPRSKTHAYKGRPPFDCIALLLQGGGALGAYQGGVYQGLAEAGLHPDWVAGISVGAINSALIAGNPPEGRVEKLRGFWEAITVNPLWALVAGERTAADALGLWGGPFSPQGDLARGWANRLNAGIVAAMGAPSMFAPRLVSPWLQRAGTVDATSYYDTSILKTTLERFVDFDRINAGETRFSVGAVNVTTGNFVYFDNTTHTIAPEHVMASGALPPGFPAVEIEGEYYWDGGLVSNTPLQWVLDSDERRDTLAFQVDLWSARGEFPRTIAQVATRQKEIQFSSRTRANSDSFKRSQKVRNALSKLLSKLPEELRDMPEYKALQPEADRKVYNLIQLIYRSKTYEGEFKDYEFSQQSREDHWRAGYHDTIRTLRHPEVLEPPKGDEGVLTFDLAMHGRE